MRGPYTHSYGKPRLLLLSSLALALLLLGLTLAAARASPALDPPVPLRLRAGTFDPLESPPPLPTRFTAQTPISPTYLIVQFRGPIEARWHNLLERTGFPPLGYLPDYAYVVRAPRQAVAVLTSLPGVRWVGEFLPAFRVEPTLWSASGPVTLTIQFFPGDEVNLRGVPDVEVLETIRTRWQTTVRIRTDGSLIPTLAALPGVRWVEPFVPPRLSNDVAGNLIGVPTIQATLGITGSGQVVAVADTGLDVGASGPITDFAGRIVSTHCLGRPSPCQWDDPHGHGTHVAGSAVGSGALSGGQFAGTAPGAALVVQSLYSPTQPGDLYVPSDLNLLFSPAYTDGARIHNDSWGSAGNRYDTWAQTADQFVWDHPDMLIVVAAGNGGIDRGSDGLVDPGSLYSPATAKNVLAVGASESLRIGQGETGPYGSHPEFPANPVHDDFISDDPNGLAAFSSRGPTADGRTKPDLVAPGTNVVSARSHHPNATYPYTYNLHYAYYSGSSQAAGLTSGAAALVRQWYAQHGLPSPSAALVKATLIHGAVDLSPGQYGPAVTGTVVVSDDVEGSGVWTSTSWVVTSTWGAHSPDHAWVAEPQGALGYRRLDATVNLSGVVSPTLLFWNRRSLSGSAARIYCGSTEVVEYNWSNGPRVGWAQEGIDLSSCAGEAAALIRFELQCQYATRCTADVWAVDDIVVADGTRLAEIGPAPDPGQGWGRLSLDSLNSTTWYTDALSGLETGEAVTFTLPISHTPTHIRATLAWSDYPALPNAEVALVNDLDLVLETAEGTFIYPNGLGRPDRRNNVEQIEVTLPPPGTYRLVVRGYNVPFGPQPYALVVTVGPLRVYLPLVMRNSP